MPCLVLGLILLMLDMFIRGMRLEFHKEMTNHIKRIFTNLVDMGIQFEAIILEKKAQETIILTPSNKPPANNNKQKFTPWGKKP